MSFNRNNNVCIYVCPFWATVEKWWYRLLALMLTPIEGADTLFFEFQALRNKQSLLFRVHF